MVYGIIITFIILIAFLLVVVILLQPGQKEGLTGGLAAGMAGGAAMGARRTADLLSKTTTILATLFLLLSVAANFAIDRGDGNQSTIQQQAIPGEMQDDFNIPSQTQPAIPQQQPSQDDQQPDDGN